MNLRRLARLARLSPSAVSLALRGSAKISAATRARVLALAREHDYRPDARIANRDFGIPAQPRIEMVESRWVEGRTLRAPARSTVD